jgi:phosphatidyl-myo-inositol dimannoside synthase
MTKHRILYLTANGFPQSSQDAKGTFSLEQVKALRLLGADVVSVDMQAGAMEKDRIDEIEITRIPRLRPLIRSLAFVRLIEWVRAYRDLKRSDYDYIIFSFFYLKYLPFVLFLRRPGVPILIIAHGGEVMPGGVLRRWLLRVLFDRVDLVTPVSEYTATLLSCAINRKNADNQKIVTIENGVNKEKLQVSQCPLALRERLGIGAEDFVVLSIALLVPRKGLDSAIQASNHLIEQGRALHHVIIGSGPANEQLRSLAAQYGHAHRFHFLNAVESADLGNFYGMADVFVLMSRTDWDKKRTEGFGITYAEALALGKPVIGGSESGVSAPVKHGFSGFLLNPYAPDVHVTMAEILGRLADDKQLYDKLSANARWYALEHLSWTRNAEQTLIALDVAKRRM